MAVTSGFYDSLNGDRKYNAEQMSAIFNGIINDGVFASVGDAFAVKAAGGNNITVGIGRAWFNSTWINNDALLPLTLADSDVLLSRWDSVVIEVNRSPSVRAASIKIIKGTPSGTPSKPALTRSTYVNQYPLAHIYRAYGSTSVATSNITNTVGTLSCPYVTGILDVVSIDNIVAQWEDEFGSWMDQEQRSFTEWIEGIQDCLDENAETKLTNEIVNLKSLYAAPEMHRMLFRGKNLGTSLTATQLAAIQNGTFDDLYLGDYWVNGDRTWRIVDFDYWYRTGDTEFTQHHIVVMPDGIITPQGMNGSDIGSKTYGGYVDSFYYRSMRDNAILRICNDVFTVNSTSRILAHRDYFTNEVCEDGYPTSGGWYDSTVDLPNEIMIYGSYIYAPSSDGSIDVKRYTTSKTQLALFSLCPHFIVANPREDYWLRDVANISRFTFVSAAGEASYGNADNYEKGYRPAFAVG